MRYNLNAGYGPHTFEKLALGIGGKTFVVGKSTVANLDMYREIMINDADGTVRFAATIKAAVALCTANAGDVIVVLPGHTETISSATDCAISKAGVTILGLGAGDTRPTLTLDTAITATIAVSVADVTLKNLVITANFADITSAITLSGTAKNFTMDGCYIRSTATDMNFLNAVKVTVTTSNACDGMKLVNNKWIEPDTATLTFLNLLGTEADVTIDNNFIQLGLNNNKAAVLTIATGKIVTNLLMTNNRVFRLNTDTATGALFVHTDGSTLSGIVANNFGQHADTSGELLITASSGLGTFNNYMSGVPGASGYILPAVDS